MQKLAARVHSSPSGRAKAASRELVRAAEQLTKKLEKRGLELDGGPAGRAAAARAEWGQVQQAELAVAEAEAAVERLRPTRLDDPAAFERAHAALDAARRAARRATAEAMAAEERAGWEADIRLRSVLSQDNGRPGAPPPPLQVSEQVRLTARAAQRLVTCEKERQINLQPGARPAGWGEGLGSHHPAASVHRSRTHHCHCHHRQCSLHARHRSYRGSLAVSVSVAGDVADVIEVRSGRCRVRGPGHLGARTTEYWYKRSDLERLPPSWSVMGQAERAAGVGDPSHEVVAPATSALSASSSSSSSSAADGASSDEGGGAEGARARARARAGEPAWRGAGARAGVSTEVDHLTASKMAGFRRPVWSSEVTAVRERAVAEEKAEMAHNYMEKREWATALELLGDALEYHPDRAVCHAQRGSCLVFLERLPEARQEFEMACSLVPGEGSCATPCCLSEFSCCPPCLHSLSYDR
jgi:tetratricopeptide (TPR) repeat protein